VTPSFSLDAASLEQLLTVAQVATILQMSIRSVRRMIADGRLPVVRLGRSVRVRRGALEAMIEGK
jgi:excisionase family DNA binding protein